MNKEFSFHTIKDFDKHIDESIPSYSLMIEGIRSIAKYFIDDESNLYDIGCSTGKLLKSINHKGKKIGIDYSENLLPENETNHKYINSNLNEGFEFNNACLILSIFTFQFLKRDKRQRLLNQIYAGLNEGGGFIFAEKVRSSNSMFQEMFNFSLYDYKRKSFTSEEILDKEVSLRKIMKPNTTRNNLKMLKKAGFKKIELYWKFYNFECFICYK